LAIISHTSSVGGEVSGTLVLTPALSPYIFQIVSVFLKIYGAGFARLVRLQFKLNCHSGTQMPGGKSQEGNHAKYQVSMSAKRDPQKPCLKL
jgi:hypothetical protein